MSDATMAYSHGDAQLRSMAGAAVHSGPASKRIVTGYGFWIFILSDMVMFSAFFATIIGFAMIWHIWWLVILGLIGAYFTFVVFAWRDHDEYQIPADEVARLDRANLAARLNLVSAAGALR